MWAIGGKVGQVSEGQDWVLGRTRQRGKRKKGGNVRAQRARANRNFRAAQDRTRAFPQIQYRNSGAFLGQNWDFGTVTERGDGGVRHKASGRGKEVCRGPQELNTETMKNGGYPEKSRDETGGRFLSEIIVGRSFPTGQTSKSFDKGG